MAPHRRGICPECGADVAVNANNRCLPHGRKRIYNRASKPTWTTMFGCRGWGREAVTVNE